MKEKLNFKGGIIYTLTSIAVGLLFLGQTPISLNEAIDAALTHSITSQQAEVQSAQGYQALAEGTGSLLPRLSASTSTSVGTIDSLRDGLWNTQLGVTQPVVDASAILSFVGGIQANSLALLQSKQTLAQLVCYDSGEDEQTCYFRVCTQGLAEPCLPAILPTGTLWV
jgi:hypothetical protein